MDSSTPGSTREQRQSVRRVLLSNAIFIALDVSSQVARTIDLSIGGMSLILPQPLPIGQVCAVTFDVPYDQSKQRALVSGRVASCIPDGNNAYRVGVRFVQADAISKQLIKTAVEQYLATDN